MTATAQSPAGPHTILVVCGLTREAALVTGGGVEAVTSGANRSNLERKLDALAPKQFAAVVSFGLAGALDPALPIGGLLVPERVLESDGWLAGADPAILAGWRASLDAAGVTCGRADILGVDRPAVTAADKARLRAGSPSAAALDMESHVAARYAAARTLPFAILRVVSDAARQDLPPLVGEAIRPDGSVDLGAALGSLVRRPGQIGSLIRTARDAAVAMRALGRVRGLLGPRLGLHL